MKRWRSRFFCSLAVLVLWIAISGCGSESKPANGDTDGAGTDGETGGLVKVVPPANWITNDQRTPQYIHLTWQHDPSTTLTLQWQTKENDLASYKPKVWFVKEKDVKLADSSADMPYSAAFVLEGSGNQYEADYGDVQNAKIVEWIVELTGLEPNTTYYYRAGTWDGFDTAKGTFSNPDLSDASTFKTAPKKGDRTPFTFVAAGDSRGGNDKIQKNIQAFVDVGARFWLFNGDMTNVGGQEEWYGWFSAMQPLMNHTPLMPIQGNHEILELLYFSQFALPVMDGLPDKLKQWAWSFNYGNIHFVGLCTNTTDLIKKEADWLKADLEAASQDPDIDWKIVMSHHSAYSSSTHGPNKTVQQYWVPLFEQYGVDLSFSGHDHDYERSIPVLAGKPAEAGKGVVYVVAGGFYAPAYGKGQEWWTANSVAGDRANYVVIEANGKTLHATARYGDDNSAIEEFTLSK